MDFRNKSISAENITSFDANKAIQSLTKAVARHGLGLYIYAGEDLPEDDKPEKSKKDILKDSIKKFPNALEVIKENGKKLSACTEEELQEILKKLEGETNE